jgi:16S rRNA (cytidine1402-2'-O)-methyltransferase
MALFVVATPIGNSRDFSLRAVDILREADLVIGEELKALRQILKAAGVQARATDQLNEHSRPADIEHFVAECREKTVALVSDCGTPGFCDPGADLVAACAKSGIAVHAVPGASSLMTLLSVCGIRVDQFTFYGFMPAKTDARAKALADLKKETRPSIVMETPYRCTKLAEDLSSKLGDRYCVLGLNLTQENEEIVRGYARDLAKRSFADAEPVVLIMPTGYRP